VLAVRAVGRTIARHVNTERGNKKNNATALNDNPDACLNCRGRRRAKPFERPKVFLEVGSMLAASWMRELCLD